MNMRAKLVVALVTALFSLWPSASVSQAPSSGFPGPSAPAPPTVVRLTIHDTIQPVTAGYLARGLREAERVHASLVLISLGTPGGLLDSTREMVTSMESSPIPIAVFVSPSGSRAASAGFFLLEAADVAAMSPGTNAGAAHPIIEGRQMDSVLKQKVENDAAAFLRSVTAPRGRNIEVAEDAVRNSKSFSANEALALKLIDLVAGDDSTLLREIDGREIKRFNGARQTLHLAGASIVAVGPSTRERLLGRLSQPDVAVLLLVFGGLLIYLEFNVPGTIVPGSLGTLLVLLGIFGLNLMPVRHTAVLLLFAAIALIALEAKFASHGVLALAGVACLVIGLATLVDAPIAEMRVHLGVAIAAGLGFGGISFALGWLALRARRNKVLTGPQAMLGKAAVVQTPMTPMGQVEIRGELWQATLPDPTRSLPVGATVIVRSIDGLILIVDPEPSTQRLSPHPAE